MALAPAEPISTSSPSEVLGHGQGLGRRPGAADHDPGRAGLALGGHDRRVGAQREGPAGQGDGAGQRGTGPVDEGHVHGPVHPGRLAELAGAVEGIHDPDPVGGEPGLVVLGLLGQHGVIGERPGQRGEDEVVGPTVAFVLQGAGVHPLVAQSGPEGDEQLPGRFGDPGGFDMVTGVRRHGG